jgi:hypothetical protein
MHPCSYPARGPLVKCQSLPLFFTMPILARCSVIVTDTAPVRLDCRFA